MIYGLLAALGWGSADFGGAIAGRKLGTLVTILISQGVSTLVVTVLFVADGAHISLLAPYLGFLVLNGIASAGAYMTHYQGLKLGPVSVVSPISAAYALVGVALSVIVFGDRPSALALVAGLIVVGGVMLASTDLRRLEQDVARSRPAGAIWAVAAAVLFGIGGFLLAYLSIRVGWVTGLWASRMSQFSCFIALAVVQRRGLRRPRDVGMIAVAVAVGLADMMGVIAFSYGAEVAASTPGLLPTILMTSAVFPLIAVVASIVFLYERPVPNQYAGIALTIGGLMLLGAVA